MLIGLLYVGACNYSFGGERPGNTPDQPDFKVFELVNSSRSGITFNNVVKEDDSMNFYRYQYLYNGAGVAIGDINNDGLPDIYFTGNLSADKLYLNKGNLKFEDITEKSGIVKEEGWNTGVTMCDINQDGLLDIYVCRSGWFEDPDKRRNLLYINLGKGKFKESAKEYGVDDPGHSVQAAFLDIDNDGDLDLYIANHPPDFKQMLKDRLEKMANPSPYASDRVYRRKSDGTYTNVSELVGVNNYGHGLGLAISDLNMDGKTDVYVANDFQTPDYYYVNQGDGSFKESLSESFPHVSYFSMGCDVADFNNDALPDLFTVEMLAEDNKRQKTNMAPMNPDIFWVLVDKGFHYQMMRNSLQVNRGADNTYTKGGRFSEIGWQAGVAQTDWSWGTLFADFNHDGWKDLIITNGTLRDTQDKDYVHESNVLSHQSGGKLNFTAIDPILPSTKVHNYVFENEGGYSFKDQSTNWGFDFYGFSYGIAFGDLDGDGDLDVVVNNTNDMAHIYQNKTMETTKSNFLKVDLEGPDNNKLGLGTKLTLKTSSGIQYQEFQITRGYQSSMDPVVHFGLSPEETVESLEVTWTDSRSQKLENLILGGTVKVSWAEAEEKPSYPEMNQSLFTRKGISPINFVHQENEYDDYEKEVLLPHKQSQHGPHITVGDANGDGLDDCFVGGAAGQAGGLYVQQSSGRFTFVGNQPWEAHAAQEDLDAVLFDADGDGDNDLYVVSGGNEFVKDSPLYQDRLYLNNGYGTFSNASEALPEMLTSGGCVVAADYDGDGDQDLFVGGRLVPASYPLPPRSYILQNDGGKFSDVTSTVCPDLISPGLITDAIWSDFTGDGKVDLVVSGEWMPIRFYENKGKSLEYKTPGSGVEFDKGWWFSITEADVDGDGKMDYIAGNLGTNYKYQAAPNAPFHVYSSDFDESGSLDIVLGYNNSGTCYPVRGLQCSSQQIPSIKKKFPHYSEFGDASIADVYGDKLDDALHLDATNFSSSWFRNLGDGKFEINALPPEAQFSPIMGVIADDFDGDGNIDLATAGNLFVSEVETGRADAGLGLIMLSDKEQNFTPLSLKKSGFYAPDDVRHLAYMKIGGRPSIVVANNNGPITVYSKR